MTVCVGRHEDYIMSRTNGMLRNSNFQIVGVCVAGINTFEHRAIP